MHKLLAFSGFCLIPVLAIAQPFSPIWSTPLDGGNRLGPCGLDENGRQYCTVGVNHHIEMFISGQRTWSSPDLNGSLNSLIRVQLENQAPILIAGVAENQEGTLAIFTGDSLEHVERRGLGSSFGVNDDEDFHTDGTSLQALNLPTNWAEDSLKTILIGQSTSLTYDDNMADSHDQYTDGNIYLYSLAQNSLLRHAGSGDVWQTLVADLDGDGTSEILVGSENTDYSYSMGPFESWSGRCRIMIFDQHLDTLNQKTLAHYSSDVGPGVAAFDGMRVIDLQDGRGNKLFVCYIDSVGYHLEKLSINLELEQSLALPSHLALGSMKYLPATEGAPPYLLFPSSGAVVAVDLIRWRVTGVVEGVFGQYVTSVSGNFDADPAPELVVLTRQDLTLYDIGSLWVTPSNPAVLPSSCILSSFPNPFNSTTTIEYYLPRPGLYALSVVDVAGREVARLADGWKVEGSYKESLNLSNAASGRYTVILLQSGQAKAQVPLVLIK